jgi:tetratricopeptide (TPR) repeat protein
VKGARVPVTVILAALSVGSAWAAPPVGIPGACLPSDAPALDGPAPDVGPEGAPEGAPPAGWGLVAPLDPDDRLLVARALAADRATHEEALDALLALLDVAATAGRAHLALVSLCREADPRPGWLDAYTRLAADRRTTAAEAAALRLRAAEARTWVPGAYVEARTTLAAAARLERAGGADAGHLDLLWHLGRAHLVLGEVDAAAAIFARSAGDPRFAAGARVAALGAPDAPAPLAARIHAIAAAGYPDLAVRLAPRDDPARADADAWAAHASVLLGRGRLGEALAAAAGEDPASVELRTRVALATGPV